MEHLVSPNLYHIIKLEIRPGNDFGNSRFVVHVEHWARCRRSRAEEAIDKRDPACARRYRDLTGGDIEALERFLGR